MFYHITAASRRHGVVTNENFSDEFSESSAEPHLLAAGCRRLSNCRVLDSELLQVRVVLRWIVIQRLHARAILVHDSLVEPDGRLVARPYEGLIFHIFVLDVLEVVPCLLDQLRMQ